MLNQLRKLFEEKIVALDEFGSTSSKGPNYVLARRAAARLIAEADIDRPPINPEKIAEELGVTVTYVKFKPEFAEKISGFFDFKTNQIFINIEIPAKRKTFTIAHELGHAVMHRAYAESNAYQAMLRENQYTNKSNEEKEADVFAACLLVPKAMLKRYRGVAAIDELSEMFVVSADVVRHQLKF